jgi:hypothetical protein
MNEEVNETMKTVKERYFKKDDSPSVSTRIQRK